MLQTSKVMFLTDLYLILDYLNLWSYTLTVYVRNLFDCRNILDIINKFHKENIRTHYSIYFKSKSYEYCSTLLRDLGYFKF